MENFLPPDVTASDLFLFSLLCLALGFVVIFLDWVLFKVRDVSLIEINYGRGDWWYIVPAWCLAAGFVAAIGVMLQILRVNFAAAIAVAVGWPLIFEKIVELGARPPIQRTTEEE